MKKTANNSHATAPVREPKLPGTSSLLRIHSFNFSMIIEEISLFQVSAWVADPVVKICYIDQIS